MAEKALGILILAVGLIALYKIIQLQKSIKDALKK